MNFFKKSIYALSLVGVTGLWSCSQEEMLSSGADNTVKGEPVKLTLTVNRGDAQTRTILSEDATTGRLNSDWVEGDELHVYDTDGKEVGTLQIESGFDSSVGVFSGEITAKEGTHQYNFWYYNLKENRVFITSDEQANRLTVNVAEQNFTSVEALSAMDILSSRNPEEYDDVIITVKDGKATVAKDVTLNSRLAMAHFTLTGLPKEAGTLEIYDVEKKIYIEDSYQFGDTNRGRAENGEGIKVTMTSGQTDVYVALIPNYASVYPEYKLGFKFTGSTGDVYTYAFTASTPVQAGVYYRGKDGNGQVIPMKKTDDAVGPIIEYGGKKWRFTRGNLKYTLSTDQWAILDNQTAFVNAGGLGVGEATKSALGSTPDEIGLFAWGATGVEDAQKPWTIRFNEWEKSVTGDYWPSTLGTSKNRTISNLLDADANYVYDFGHTYMQKGRSANDKREYITPPQSAFVALMEGCFVQGATLKGLGENGEDVYGLLCIPGEFKLAEAKEFIKSVDGATCLSSMVNVIHNNNGTTLNYEYITITKYEALKALNDAVFFPAASKRNLNSDKVYNSDGKGFYWQATGSSSGTNGFDLFFDGKAGGFFYKETSTNASMGRFNQMAIRLLVEVPEKNDCIYSLLVSHQLIDWQYYM